MALWQKWKIHLTRLELYISSSFSIILVIHRILPGIFGWRLFFLLIQDYNNHIVYTNSVERLCTSFLIKLVNLYLQCRVQLMGRKGTYQTLFWTFTLWWENNIYPCLNKFCAPKTKVTLFSHNTILSI